MRRTALLFSLFAVCLFSNAGQVIADRPNVVLIFIDDMGWTDTQYGHSLYSGSDLYETPNIDRLASQGMRFTSAYASAGNCEPSRAVLISGQYTPRHHMYAVSSTNRGPKRHMRVKPVPNVNNLPIENVTVAEAMQKAGYATGMFGKWHLGNSPEFSPAAQGFDITDVANGSSNRKFPEDNDPKHAYRITDAANQFMESHKDEPFFCYIAHHATHMSVQARDDMHAKFQKKGPGKQHQHTKFAAMNGEMDRAVGRTLDKIDELGIADNTVVLFTADNGGLPQSPQTPLRGFKGMYYEGGIRVPMIARWPDHIEPGSECDVPVLNVDFYPTFLDLAGGNVPAGKVLDGESLTPLMTQSGPLERDSIFWHFPGYLDGPNLGSRDPIFRTRPTTTIRKGDWKLLLFHEEWSLDGGRAALPGNKAVELYNLANDISEANDLSASHAKKRNELLDDVLQWVKDTDAIMASQPNPAFGKKPAEKKRKRKKTDS